MTDSDLQRGYLWLISVSLQERSEDEKLPDAMTCRAWTVTHFCAASSADVLSPATWATLLSPHDETTFLRLLHFQRVSHRHKLRSSRNIAPSWRKRVKSTMVTKILVAPARNSATVATFLMFGVTFQVTYNAVNLATCGTQQWIADASFKIQINHLRSNINILRFGRWCTLVHENRSHRLSQPSNFVPVPVKLI